MKLRVFADKAAASVARALAPVAAKGKAVLMSLALGASLALPAFASEGGSGSDSDMTSLIAAADNVTTMTGKVWTLIMSNPLLTTYAACGLLSVGIGFFLYLKKAARH